MGATLTKQAAALMLAGSALFTGSFAAMAAPDPSANYDTVSRRLVDRGREAMDSKSYDKAIAYFEQAATAFPQNARAFSWLGRSHAKAGDEDKARKYYGIALSIDPDDRKALLWMGESDVTRSDRDAAASKLARLERLCGPGCSEFRLLSKSLETLDEGSEESLAASDAAD